MKTIELSDSDYNALMELSKELQLQDNDSNAFPYYWVPASKKAVNNITNEGSIIDIYYDQETYSPESFAEYYESFYKEFLKVHVDILPSKIEYNPDLERDWIDYVEYEVDEATIYSSDMTTVLDHNPSLFKSDVKRYINTNQHHLGQDPHTYAQTIFRMPKMEQLVKLMYRMNPQPEMDITHEARRFVKEGLDRIDREVKKKGFDDEDN